MLPPVWHNSPLIDSNDCHKLKQLCWIWDSESTKLESKFYLQLLIKTELQQRGSVGMSLYDNRVLCDQNIAPMVEKLQ